MIYFDNAATSFPKPRCVIDEVVKCISCYCGNPGRGSHTLAIKAAEKIFETREDISEFLRYEKSENIVFTHNATHALNLVIKGLIDRKLHCIVSDLEHNSVLRPLYKTLKKYGGSYSVFDSDQDPNEAIPPLVRKDTALLICTLCSNVTGKSVDFDTISKIASQYNLKLIVDASQYLGHKDLCICDKHFSALCCAGHKGLFGIQGSAFTVINERDLFETLIEGGSGIDSFSEAMPYLLPERYEAGTISTPAIASLGAGIKYISDVGIDRIEHKLFELTSVLKDDLKAVNGIRIYGGENGILSFNIKNYPSSYVSDLLNRKEIATRAGFHCSPMIHKKLGTDDIGAVRVSLSYFNTEKEIYTLKKELLTI